MYANNLYSRVYINGCFGTNAAAGQAVSSEAIGADSAAVFDFVFPSLKAEGLSRSRLRFFADQGDGDETRAAQGAFLKELGMASELVQ